MVEDGTVGRLCGISGETCRRWVKMAGVIALIVLQGPKGSEKHGKQSCAEGRGVGRERREVDMEANKVSIVSETTKQETEIRDRWSWVEACVWTDRMLAALENGVKGGCWFSLI